MLNRVCLSPWVKAVFCFNLLFFLQTTVRGECQLASARGEGEQWEEASESHQRGAAVAAADGWTEPSHVPEWLPNPSAPLRTGLPRPPSLLPSMTLSADVFLFFSFLQSPMLNVPLSQFILMNRWAGWNRTELYCKSRILFSAVSFSTPHHHFSKQDLQKRNDCTLESDSCLRSVINASVSAFSLHSGRQIHETSLECGTRSAFAINFSPAATSGKVHVLSTSSVQILDISGVYEWLCKHPSSVLQLLVRPQISRELSCRRSLVSLSLMLPLSSS